jgi:hypothetical protein
MVAVKSTLPPNNLEGGEMPVMIVLAPLLASGAARAFDWEWLHWAVIDCIWMVAYLNMG